MRTTGLNPEVYEVICNALDLGDLEHRLVKSIPWSRRLNSQPGGLKEYWIPPAWVKEINDKIDNQHQLKSSVDLEEFLAPSTSSNSSEPSTSLQSSIQQAASKFAEMQTGPIIHPEALKVVERWRGGAGYRTYAGRCLSVSALKDIPQNAHMNKSYIGRSFDSWRHLNDLIGDKNIGFELPIADSVSGSVESSKESVYNFGLILDIWHLIVWHICWNWCLIFFYWDIVLIDPLFVMSWSNLQAALWFRFEAFAQPENLSVIPQVELTASEMFEAVGKLVIGRHGSRYHLHLCDFHLGVLKYRGKLRSKYLELSICINLYRKLVLLVLKDKLTRASTSSGTSTNEAPITDLAWFQEARSTCIELATAIGLLDRLSAAKSRLQRHSHVDAILVSRRRLELDRAHANARSTPLSNIICNYDAGRTPVITEDARKTLQRWELVMKGKAGSKERLDQLSSLKRNSEDKAARGVDQDPYRIDIGNSDNYERLLHFEPGKQAKWALNASGRTVEGKAHADACRALGTAAINTTEAILNRTPDTYDIKDVLTRLIPRLNGWADLDAAAGPIGAKCGDCSRFLFTTTPRSSHFCRSGGDRSRLISTLLYPTSLRSIRDLVRFVQDHPDERTAAVLDIIEKTPPVDLSPYELETISVYDGLFKSTHFSFNLLNLPTTMSELQTYNRKLGGIVKFATLMLGNEELFRKGWIYGKCHFCEHRVIIYPSKGTRFQHYCSDNKKRTTYATLGHIRGLHDLPPYIASRIWLTVRSAGDTTFDIRDWAPTE